MTLFKVHKLALNLLGYIPGISVSSGCVRIGTGLTMRAVALLVDEANTHSSAIIQHWLSEALLTGITQIARGALEAFLPFGWKANAFLDTIATIYNVKKQYSRLSFNFSF